MAAAWRGGSGGGALAARLAAADAVLHNQDNREHDILDSDDYYQFQGGLAAAVETLKGAAPRIYHGDHSRPEKPVVRALGEEIGRVVRGRATNPKWIAGMMRHGYRAPSRWRRRSTFSSPMPRSPMPSATTISTSSTRPMSCDDAVRDFIAVANPAALREMAARFREAIDARPVDAARQQRA